MFRSVVIVHLLAAKNVCLALAPQIRFECRQRRLRRSRYVCTATKRIDDYRWRFRSVKIFWIAIETDVAPDGGIGDVLEFLRQNSRNGLYVARIIDSTGQLDERLISCDFREQVLQ